MARAGIIMPAFLEASQEVKVRANVVMRSSIRPVGQFLQTEDQTVP